MSTAGPPELEPVPADADAGAVEAWDFLVAPADLHRRALHDAPPNRELSPGEVVVGVDAFALTANNLTYAVTGERFGYWRLFPAPDGWGRIPAWGFGTVVASASPDVEVGERFAGMVPMSTHFVARPKLTRDGFADLTAYRAEVNPVYNRYTRVTGRPDAELERDAALRPVCILSFVLAHHLHESGYSGAERVLVTSASSKASLGLAHALRSAGVSVVGLTSPHNRELVRATGLYGEVATYDHITDLDVDPDIDPRTVLIDVTGNPAVRDELHQRLGTSLVDTVHVGQTDWDQPTDGLLGSADGTTPFFAPTVIQRLVGEWGPAEFARRLDTELAAFTAHSTGWLDVDHRDGRDAMSRAFDNVADGVVPPDRFLIVRPRLE